MRPKRIALLGATGSIGESTQKVARQLPHALQIVAMSAKSHATKLARAANEFGVRRVCVEEESTVKRVRDQIHPDADIVYGEEGLIALATHPEVDMVLIAIVGTAGLRPALAAIEAGKDLAIASKEILVMAGPLIMEAARRHRVRILPVDSEHNAIFQCLEGQDVREVRRLILTCSGGPFRDFSEEQLASVTPEMALCHPTWRMGKKITVDSATLFNKGLEIIEARWLFDVPAEQIDVVVHPQSVVHSMVEFVDGSVLAQMSNSDMCFPIQYAVTYPRRVANQLAPLDFSHLSRLDFCRPRREVFPALDLAYEACRTGGTLPAVLNAANEEAVKMFLEKEISFSEIWRRVKHAMKEIGFRKKPSLEEILEADQETRKLLTYFHRNSKNAL